MHQPTQALVTGGAGFIGSFLVDRLLAEGYRVRMLDLLDPQVHAAGAPRYLNPAADLVVGDVRDRALLAQVLDGCEVVIHCAAAVGVSQSLYKPEHYVDVNVRGTATLLDLLIERRAPLKKLLVPTSMTGYGEGLYRRPSDGKLLRPAIRSDDDVRQFGWDPVCLETGEALEPVPTPESAALLASNVYALTKRYQEELVLSLGATYRLPVACLRLFNVYGPRQSLGNPYTGVLAIFLGRLLAGRAPVVYEDGNQSRDFVSVHDVVDAFMLALERPTANGQVFNLSGGQVRGIADCARTLARLLGRPELAPEISETFRAGDIRHCQADLARARALLGYAPKMDWEDGLAELVAWSASAPSADLFDLAQRELNQRGLVA